MTISYLIETGDNLSSAYYATPALAMSATQIFMNETLSSAVQDVAPLSLTVLGSALATFCKTDGTTNFAVQICVIQYVSN